MIASTLIIGALLAACPIFFGSSIFSAKVIRQDGSRGRLSLAVPYGLLFLAALTWETIVNRNVPEPYLDEIFHIPQAQRYCQGKWLEWDDKITTPPGLYWASVFFLQQLVSLPGRAIDWILNGNTSREYLNLCAASDLRMTNVWSTLGVGILATMCRSRIERNSAGNKIQGAKSVLSNYALHTGINIALMPILFFFSGLYYTDVMSTLVVLLSYAHHLNRVAVAGSSVLSDLVTIFLGVAALCMRQTNVFWVVVYMGGLEAVHAIKSITHNSRASKIDIHDSQTFADLNDLAKRFWETYSGGHIHDPSLDRATPDDPVYTILSLAIAVIYNPVRVLGQVWPHITIMVLFAAFVVWNDGVVLGDKSNHVATLHLAQMLYIWPLFAFLAWPVMSVVGFPIFSGIMTFFGFTGTNTPKTGNPSSEKCQESAQSTGSGSQLTESSTVQFLRSCTERRLYLIPVAFVAVLGTLRIIRFNTIVHPFTLADNRHYMFYVARYTIRRSLMLRNQLLWAYLGAAMFALLTLVPALKKPHAISSEGPKFTNRPFAGRWTLDEAPKGDSKKMRSPDFTSVEGGLVLATLDQYDASTKPAHVSTVILWLLATSMSLITAPLIEPRYFIIPWAMWRLLLPAWTETEALSSTLGFLPFVGRISQIGKRVDLRVFLETFWFVAVNVFIMAIFILKPFQWRAEDGTLLDEGRLQRFMW